MRILWGLTAVFLLAGTGRASATPPDTFGFGSRSASLAGAVTADVEDWTANYYNPAGLVRAGGLSMGMNYAATRLRHRINEVDSDLEPVRGINLGFIAPLEVGSVRFAFGVGLYFAEQRLSRTRSVTQERPHWELYDSRPHAVWINANLAVQPVDWLRLGLGVTFQSASDLVLEVRGEASVLPGSSNTRLEHRFAGSLKSMRYFAAGIQVDPIDELSFGITYRGEYALPSRLEATVTGDLTGLGDPLPVRFAYESNSVYAVGPQQVAFGFAARPIPRLRLSAEVTWVDWSVYQSPIDEMVQIDLEPPPAFGVEVPTEIEVRPSPVIEWRDRWVPRVGIEYRAVEGDFGGVDLRLGYFYEKSPVPPVTSTTNYVDTSRHALAFGIGLDLTNLQPTLPGALRINAHFQYARLVRRDFEKESLVDVVGDLRIDGQQFAGGIGLELAFE